MVDGQEAWPGLTPRRGSSSLRCEALPSIQCTVQYAEYLLREQEGPLLAIPYFAAVQATRRQTRAVRFGDPDSTAKPQKHTKICISFSTFLWCIPPRHAQASKPTSPSRLFAIPSAAPSLILSAVLFRRVISTIHHRSRDLQVMRLSLGASLLRVQIQSASSPRRRQKRP